MKFLRSKIFIVLLTLALLGSVFILDRQGEKRRKARRVAKEIEVATYGDGHFKSWLSKPSLGDIDVVISKVGEANCEDIVDLLIKAKNHSELGILSGSLDLHQAEPVQSALSKIPGVSGPEIWDGLKEINSLIPEFHGLEESIRSDWDYTGRVSSMGSSAGLKGKELEEHYKHVEEVNDETIKRIEASQKQIAGLHEQMKGIAALMLVKVPKDHRKEVVETLGRLLGDEE